MLHMLVDVFLCKFELDNKSCDSLFDSKPTLWERSGLNACLDNVSLGLY